MGYTQHYVESNIHFCLFYRCPYCGKISVNRQYLRASTQYSGTQRGASQAGTANQKKLLEKTATVFKNAENKKFGASKFDVQCSNCSETPVWSHGKSRLVQALELVALFAALLGVFLLISMVVGEGSSTLVPAIVLLGIAALAFFLRYLKFSMMDRKAAELAEENLPTMFLSAEAMLQEIEKFSKEERDQIQGLSYFQFERK